MMSHSKTSKIIHWTFTLLYSYGIFKQVDDLSELEDPSLLNLEIIFAIIFLIIVLIRYFYMKDAPTLLGATKKIRPGHLFLAKSMHRLIYSVLIMLPTTGLLIAVLFNLGIGGIDFAVALHEFSALLSYVLIAMHIGAAFYSKLKGEGVWNGMVPVWKETKKYDSELLTKIKNIENRAYDKLEEILRI